MKWSIISVIYSQDTLGKRWYEIIQPELQKEGICVTYSTSLPVSNLEAAHMDDVYFRLGTKQLQQENEVLGVLYLGNTYTIRTLLEFVSTKPVTVRKLQWILPSYIGEDINIRKTLTKFDENTFVYVTSPTRVEFSQFSDFAIGIFQKSVSMPSNHSLNPWMDKYISDVYDHGDVDNDFTQFTHVYPTVKGVLSLAVTLKALHQEKCGESYIGICSSLLEYINTQGLTSYMSSMNVSTNHTSPLLNELPGIITIEAQSGYLSLNNDRSIDMSYITYDSTQYNKVRNKQ